MNEESIPEDISKAAVTAHAGWVANLKAAYLPTVREQEFFFLRHVEAALLAERERCAKACEAQKEVFSSPEYATNQPLSSFAERIACDACAAAIRKPTP